MTDAQEKKSRRIALITSLGAHGLVLLLLLFIVAWRAPNPPLPEFGIELNFGMDTQGSGNIQPQTPVASADEANEEQEEVVENLPEPEPEPVTEEIVEEPAREQVESVQPEVTSKIESPVVVEEKKESKPVETPKEKPVEKPAEKKPEPKPQVTEVPKAVYKPKTEATEGGKTGTPGNHGDDTDKTGDKGDPQGALDSKALYGKQGGGGGGVAVRGFGTFGYPDISTPKLPEEPNGIYKFHVKIDEDGYVINIETLERGISLEAERRLKATIQTLRFIPKGSPKGAEGEITFRVTTQ